MLIAFPRGEGGFKIDGTAILKTDEECGQQCYDLQDISDLLT